ncbi:DMT family transporter [Clostridioides difficile]
MNIKVLVIIAMSITSVIWANSFFITKNISAMLGPITLCCIRFLIAIVPIYIFRLIKNDREKISKDDKKKFILLMLVGVPVYFYLSNKASCGLSIKDSVALSAMQSIIMLVAKSVFLGVLITPTKILYVGIATIGAIITMDNMIITSEGLINHLLMFMATTLWVGYCIIILPFLKKYKITTIIYYQCLYSIPLVLPFLFLEDNKWEYIGNVEILQLLYIGVLCISVGYTFNAFSLKYVGAIRTSLFLNIGPVLVIIVNKLSLKSTWLIDEVLGTTLIIIGIILAVNDMFKNKTEVREISNNE